MKAEWLCRLEAMANDHFSVHFSFLSYAWADVVSGHPCRKHMEGHYKQLYQLAIFFVKMETCFSSIMPGIGVWLCGFGTQSLLPSAVTNKADLVTSNKIFQNRNFQLCSAGAVIGLKVY